MGERAERRLGISTLDSESSDRGSNPREVLCTPLAGINAFPVSTNSRRGVVDPHLWSSGYDVSLTR